MGGQRVVKIQSSTRMFEEQSIDIMSAEGHPGADNFAFKDYYFSWALILTEPKGLYHNYYSYDNQQLITWEVFSKMLQNLVEAIATKGITVKPPLVLFYFRSFVGKALTSELLPCILITLKIWLTRDKGSRSSHATSKHFRRNIKHVQVHNRYLPFLTKFWRRAHW